MLDEKAVRIARAANNVKRFHTVERIREETVGHHSANVGAILLYLNPKVSRSALIYVLMHDWPELDTGDIPAPTKWASELLENEILFMEEKFWRDRLGTYPPAMTMEELMLVKAADMLDLVMSSMEEMHRGNQYAEELVNNGMNYLRGMNLPTETIHKINDLVEQP